MATVFFKSYIKCCQCEFSKQCVKYITLKYYKNIPSDNPLTHYTCYGLTCVPLNLYVQVLTPSISECDGI